MFLSTSISRQFLGNFVTRFSGLLFGFILDYLFAHKLGANKYGAFSFCLAMVNVLSVFSVLGIPTSIIKHLSGFEKDKSLGSKYIFYSIKIVFFISIILGALASALGYIFPHIISADKSIVIPYIPLFSVYLVAFSLNRIFQGVFDGLSHSSFSILNKEVLGRVIKLAIFLVIGFALNFSFLTMCLSFLIGEVITMFIFYFTLESKKGLKITDLIKEPLSKSEKNKYVIYSISIAASSIIALFLGEINKIILGLYLSYSDVAIYTICLNLLVIIFVGLSIVNSIVMPKAAKYYNSNDIPALQSLYKFSSNVITMVVLPVFLGLILYSSNILALYGKEYVKGSIILPILSSAVFINAITGANYPLIVMSKHYKFEFYNTIIAAALNFLLLFLLVRFIGLKGAAICYFVIQLSLNVIRCIFLYIKYKLVPYDVKYLYFFIIPLLAWPLYSGLNLLVMPVLIKLGLNLSVLSIASCIIYVKLVSGPIEKALLVKAPLVGAFISKYI